MTEEVHPPSSFFWWSVREFLFADDGDKSGAIDFRTQFVTGEAVDAGEFEGLESEYRFGVFFLVSKELNAGGEFSLRFFDVCIEAEEVVPVEDLVGSLSGGDSFGYQFSQLPVLCLGEADGMRPRPADGDGQPGIARILSEGTVGGLHGTTNKATL